MNDSSSNILQHSEAGVCTITLNRADKKNALTSAMYAALADALDAAAADRAVRVALIQGNSQTFSAGNDIADFLQQPPAAQTGTHSAPVLRFLRALAGFPKPLLAAVCGPAVGVGTTMLLHCDLVWAGDNARFSTPFVNLGLCPEAASSLLLPQLLGYRRAAQVLLTGEPFDARSALDWGLVNRVLPAPQCGPAMQEMARQLAAKPPAALIETKRLMKAGQSAQVLATIEQEGASFARMLHEPAAREALAAFMAKRKPDFSAL